jgi:hypothetical protein
MKKVLSHVRNNLGRYFIIFNLFLSVVGILAGFRAYKIEQYDDPLIVILGISNLFWFLFGFFASVPEQKEYRIDKETGRVMYLGRDEKTGRLMFIEEDEEIVLKAKASINKYTWLIDIFRVLCIFVGVLIIFTNVAMAIIIMLKSCLAHSGGIFT